METLKFSLDLLYDLELIFSHIQANSFKKIIFQTPNPLLAEIFQLKRLVLHRIPDLSINVLCDKHVFFNLLINIFIV